MKDLIQAAIQFADTAELRGIYNRHLPDEKAVDEGIAKEILDVWENELAGIAEYLEATVTYSILASCAKARLGKMTFEKAEADICELVAQSASGMERDAKFVAFVELAKRYVKPDAAFSFLMDEDELNSMQEKIKELTKSLSEAKAEKQRLAREVEKSKEDNEALTKKYIDLQQAHQTSLGDVYSLEQEVKEARKKIHELNVDLQLEKEKTSPLETEIVIAKSVITQFKNEKQQLESDEQKLVKNHKAELNWYKDEISRLSSENYKLGAHIKQKNAKSPSANNPHRLMSQTGEGEQKKSQSSSSTNKQQKNKH